MMQAGSFEAGLKQLGEGKRGYDAAIRKRNKGLVRRTYHVCPVGVSRFTPEACRRFVVRLRPRPEDVALAVAKKGTQVEQDLLEVLGEAVTAELQSTATHLIKQQADEEVLTARGKKKYAKSAAE